MKTTLTRSQKLFYSFLLAGCFFAVAAMDDGAEQAERSQQHADWIMKQAQQEEHDRFYSQPPGYVNAPAFVGKPNYDRKFAMLRAEHEVRKAVK